MNNPGSMYSNEPLAYERLNRIVTLFRLLSQDDPSKLAPLADRL